MKPYLINLTAQQIEVVMKSLNQACQGVEAASIVLPVFGAIKQQVEQQESEDGKQNSSPQ